MENLPIDADLIVHIKLTGVAELLKPIVFKEGDSYSCILGLDPVHGVFGCGETPEAAVADWDETLQLRLKDNQPDDQIIKYVRQVIDSLPKPPHIQAFYDQFRPAKK